MINIQVDADCGKVAKKLFLKDFNIASAEGDAAFMIEQVSDDIIWDIVGDRIVEGKEEFKALLEEVKENQVVGLLISRILTHGKEAAVNGELTMQNGEVYAFADFYEFSSARSTSIKYITSYVMPT